jgi:L-Ala-D/L-Glu epimerase
MIIKEIRVYKSRIKLKEPFVTSLGAHEHAENVVVTITTSSGLKGFGECSPFLTINGESIDTCFVVAGYLGKALIGMDARNLNESALLMDRVIYGNSSIKSAFDIALYDLASQHAGVPLYSFLGGKKNKTLVTDYTVSIADTDKMVSDARKIKADGYSTIKVKLGGSKEDDLERIKAIRTAVGNTITLRIDANQGWDSDDAIELLNELAKFNIQFCEEPIPRWNYMELPHVMKKSPIPIMADESCCDHHDAKRLIDLDACDLFNIKLGKSSGFTKALQIIKLAENANMKMQVGGFLESRLGFTASAHLALCSDNILYCDFDTPMMFEEDPVNDGIIYGKHGMITVPDQPGLGASMDDNYLKGLPNQIIN